MKPRWEYTTVLSSLEDPSEKFNELGRQGWELQTVTTAMSIAKESLIPPQTSCNQGYIYVSLYIFRREIT